MEKKMEQSLLVQVIRERKYKDIPSWIICTINNEGFLLLLNDVLHNVIKEDYMTTRDCGKESILGDVQNVLTRIRSVGNVWDSTMYHFLSKLDNGTMLLAALVLENNREWKRYLKNSDMKWFVVYSAFASNDVLMALVVSYTYYEKMLPKALLGLLFYAWNRQMEEGVDMRPAIDVFLQQAVVWQGMSGTPEHFLGTLWENIWHYRHKYFWIEQYFFIDRCWFYGWNYYPYNHEEWVYSYLCYMGDHFQEKPIPQKIYSHLEKFLLDESYLDEYKRDLETVVYKIITMNANNLFLLCPFLKWYRKYYIEKWFQLEFSTKFQFSENMVHPLEDYHVFYELAGDRARNHHIQIEFLKSGGNPCSLLDIPHSVIYTIEGICTAMDYSKESDLVAIFDEEEVRNLLMKQYLQEGYSPSRTFRLLKSLGHYPKKKYDELYYWVRTKFVNLDSIQSKTDTSVCRVIPLEFQEVVSILEKCPDAITNIPFGKMEYSQFLKVIHGKDCYVPLYFGSLFVNGSSIQSVTSLDAFLNTKQLLDLLIDYPAYLGDIKTETKGVILLEFLCL